MKSLHSRLLASYTLIILLCLAVVGIALMLLLARLSLTDRQIYAELALLARWTTLRPGIDEFLSDPSSPRMEQTLERIADLQNVRFILAEPDGRIVADTQNSLVGHNLLNESNLREQTAEKIEGSFRPAGTLQRWLFVGNILPNPQNSRVGWLIVAKRAPRLPIFQLFGENILAPLLQAGLVGFILSILLAWLISRSVARPIQQTAAAAHAVAEGDYDQQLPLSGPSEVRELAASFNQMASQVKTSQQAQQDFVANVSHDLKTPLTSIQGFSQAILDGTAADSAETQRAATIIHQEAGRMRRMVDDLLLLARMDAGEVKLERQPIDLPQLLKGCITRLGPRADQNGVVLNLQTPAEALPQLNGDGDRLVQLFTNLLDNAVKHSPAGGRVTVTVEQLDEQLVVAVADTGPGIPPDQLSRIFERFYQVDKSRARTESRGTGLGLAICKELAEAHGGRITAESVVGVGSKLSVYLPTAAAAPTLVARRRS